MSLRERVLGRILEERARAEKATPGPWGMFGMTVYSPGSLGVGVVEPGREIADTHDPDRGLRTFNGDFICSARTLLPALLAEAQRQVEEHAPWPDTDYCRSCSNESAWPMSECPIITGWARVFGEGE